MFANNNNKNNIEKKNLKKNLMNEFLYLFSFFLDGKYQEEGEKTGCDNMVSMIFCLIIKNILNFLMNLNLLECWIVSFVI